MSKSGSADTAKPGASPAERAVGSAPAPRKRRVACRLIVLVALPTVLGLTLAGFRVADATRSADGYGQVGRLAELNQQVTGLAQAMEDERADVAAFVARGRPAAGVAALHRQYAITNGRAASVRLLASGLGHGYPAEARASAASVLASVAQLPSLREHAVQRQAPELTVVGGYSAAITGLLSVDDSIAGVSADSALITTARTLGSLSRMKDQASLQQAILGAALTAGHFGPGALAALTTAEARQASDLVSFRGSATREQNWALTRTLAGPLAGQASSVEQRATGDGVRTLATLGGHADQQWQAGMSYTVGWMRSSERQLAGWITAYAGARQRSETRSAMITGAAALAALLLVVLPTVLFAQSLARPMRRPEEEAREAARLAGEEARLRGSASAVSASFLQRGSSLLEPLLRLIDSVELNEDDPERLTALFQIDHLVTRVRRAADSALVLAGHQTPARWTEPVALVDVLRAAMSEIEQYDRVSLDVQPALAVAASAAVDLVHLLAELMENAAAFSSTTTQVIVSGRAAPDGGWQILIADQGAGMAAERLRQLNSLLARPPLADAAVAGQVGLLAVAHLAARHGIKVTLGSSPAGGSTAEAHIPAALLSPVPLVSHEAVPQLLAAPLPPQPPAVAVPEPAGSGPGGLPIFESVKSEYVRARGGGLLESGLPRRTRRATLAPGNVTGRETPQPRSAESAQIARTRLASFQQGSRRARADRNPKPAQDR
jgi:signal transduction histidine kinase